MKSSIQGPKWLVDWRRDAVRRIESLRNNWRRERELLDLDIETNLLEASFSKEVSNMMQHESQLAAEGNVQDHEIQAQRVDKLLVIETSKHFNAQAEVNMKKLSALFRKQALEKETFSEELTSQFKAICETAQVDTPEEMVIAARMSLKREQGLDSYNSPLELFAAEERRLWRLAQQELPEAERFNIANAFSLQLERVDAEWAAHDEQMKLNYEAQLNEIQGRSAHRTTVKSPVGRWKSKEKQSRLISTAPVHQPSTPSTLSTPNSSTISKQSEDDLVLEQLRAAEMVYEQDKLMVNFQKQNAKRWIERQARRMNIQIDAMAKCKLAIGTHMEKEEIALKGLLLRIDCFCEVMSEMGCLPHVLRTSTTHNSVPLPSTRAPGNAHRPDLVASLHVSSSKVFTNKSAVERGGGREPLSIKESVLPEIAKFRS